MMNEKYKLDFIHAGKLAGQVRAFGKSLIKKGASYQDVISQINQKIFSLDAIPAFPPQIALNEVAAHFLPEPGMDIIFSDEVVKLDVGVCYKGAIGDCAVTVDLSGHNQKLIEAAEAALLFAEESIRVGLPLREIGRIIEKTVSSFRLKPIKNLSGHGLGLNRIHTPPRIPNYDDHSTDVIKPGMTFAIEPFVTDGSGLIYEEGSPTIFSEIPRKSVPSFLSSSLLLKIRSFKGLPFAIHDLVGDESSILEVKQKLQELLDRKIIVGYPPLVEEGKGLVAQAENSILVDNQGKVFVTTK